MDWDASCAAGLPESSLQHQISNFRVCDAFASGSAPCPHPRPNESADAEHATAGRQTSPHRLSIRAGRLQDVCRVSFVRMVNLFAPTSMLLRTSYAWPVSASAHENGTAVSAWLHFPCKLSFTVYLQVLLVLHACLPRRGGCSCPQLLIRSFNFVVTFKPSFPKAATTTRHSTQHREHLFYDVPTS